MVKWGPSKLLTAAKWIDQSKAMQEATAKSFYGG